jgi:ABC-type multidrug transport system fused ATPase/permease subunit
LRVLLRLSKYAWRHPWYLVGAYVTMTLATLSAMAVPPLLGTAVDQALESGLRSQLFLLALAVIGVSVLRALFSYGQNYLAEALSHIVAYELRNDIFEKLQSLSFGFHDKEETGNLMSKATSDVDAVRFYVSMGMVRGLTVIVMVVAVAALMLATNWRLGVISLAFVPLVMWRATVMANKLVVNWMLVQAETGRMTSVLQENLAGMRVVKAFGAREHEEARFEEKAASIAHYRYAVTRLFASQGSIMTFILSAATAGILFFGIREIEAGRLTHGEMVAFILYMGLLAMPVRMTGWIVNVFSWAASAGQRLYEVLDAESTVEEKPGAPELPRVGGHIRFDNVSMTYDSGVPVIRDVSFEAERGQMVAILGAPGSGKSTIVHLIPRFYDVTTGGVTIDGHDLRDVALASLRRNVGIVLQDIFVFGTSIRENIAYGAEDAGLDDIVRAAKVAQLHGFIEDLPDGYDTLVGERGATLSGGQRQRLAIARTLLLDPPVLILDDSTSSVDVGTEHEIQRALEEVVKDRTTFVIAHRLSTVRRADLILVVDHGEIVERGTHEELLTGDGFYRRIHDLQLKPQDADVTVGDLAPAAGGDL